MTEALKDEVACEAGCDDYKDGMDAGEVDDAERGDADDAREDPVGGLVTKILAIHEQECGTGDKSNDDGAQPDEGSLEGWTVFVARYPMAGEEHQQEWRQDNGESCDNGAPNRASDDVANVGGTIDTDRTRSHLRDSDNVSEHLAGKPARANHLALDEREHCIAPAETE